VFKKNKVALCLACCALLDDQQRGFIFRIVAVCSFILKKSIKQPILIAANIDHCHDHSVNLDYE